MTGFGDVLTSMEQLRQIIPPPEAPAVNKGIDHLDEHCRAFIAHSPFLVLASADAEGRCDASPKGGPPGFVKVLDDHRLAMPDAPGNRRLDSHANLLSNPRAALIFFVPDYGETLRVEGRVVLSTDPDLRESLTVDGKVPKLAMGMEIEQAYLQCARAVKRSGIWAPDTWPDISGLPTAGRIFKDHIALPGITEDAANEHLAESYQPANLW